MAHEDFSREEKIEGSSDRAFGFVFAAVFAVIGAWPLLSSAQVRWWALALAGLFALAALAFPSLLGPLNRWWMRLGLLLGRIFGPVALGILFYAVFTPTGVLMRLAGKDPLRLRRAPATDTYWIGRQPPGPPPDSMTNQF
jgi:hypothetical protein